MRMTTLATLIVGVAHGSSSGLDQIAYLTYNTDSECQNIAVVKAVLSGVPFNIPILHNNTNPCDDLVACAVNVSSSQCTAVGGSVNMTMAEFNVEVRNNGQDVYECDTSNTAVGEDICDFKGPNSCFPSSVLQGCYVRYVTSHTFNQLNVNAAKSCEKVGSSDGGSRELGFSAFFTSVLAAFF